MNHPHAVLLTRFYEAFQRRDPEGMIACYHPNVVFMDPVFGRLRLDEVSAMWRMLNSRAKDLQLSFSNIDADEHCGSVQWEAVYTFSKTGRRVHNKIDAQFGFYEGLILAHRDRFDLWKWSRMAFGAKGLLLGWTPLIRKPIQMEARRGLETFMA